MPEQGRYVHSELELGTILGNLRFILEERRENEDAAIELAEMSGAEKSVSLPVIEPGDVESAMEI